MFLAESKLLITLVYLWWNIQRLWSSGLLLHGPWEGFCGHGCKSSHGGPPVDRTPSLILPPCFFSSSALGDCSVKWSPWHLLLGLASTKPCAAAMLLIGVVPWHLCAGTWPPGSGKMHKSSWERHCMKNYNDYLMCEPILHTRWERQAIQAGRLIWGWGGDNCSRR